MKQYYETEETARLDFARKAAKHFEENPQNVTFSRNGPEKGEFFALRWGAGLDCVVVFKIHEYEDIINYCEFIDRDKAALCADYHAAGTHALEMKGIKPCS